MPDELSIPDLLSLLQIDRNHTAIQLSLEADRLCRRREYKQAIDAAYNATQLVRTDPWLLGETLLYLSYARLCSAIPDQVKQATRDCDRAIRALGLSRYDYAIANLIRGQMELQTGGVQGRSSALRYFQRASEALGKLRTEESQYNRAAPAKRCAELKERADRQIAQLTQEMTTPPEVNIPPKQRPPKPQEPPQPEPEKKAAPFPKEMPVEVPLGDALIMQRLVWPPTEPPLIFDSSPTVGSTMLDFLGIPQLSVHNRIYDVKPIVGDDLVHLRLRQNYWIVPIEGAQRGELALVREQARPDQVGQFVAINEPPQARTWIDITESTDNFTQLHIIGIVDAVLVPVAAEVS